MLASRWDYKGSMKCLSENARLDEISTSFTLKEKKPYCQYEKPPFCKVPQPEKHQPEFVLQKTIFQVAYSLLVPKAGLSRVTVSGGNY
jgi:hypothetical protein